MKRDVIFARKRPVPSVSGGILALTYPAILIILALGAGFRQGGDMADFAATLAGTVLLLIALPTSWVLSFPFIDVTRFTVLTFGVVTSAPLWYLLGAGLARGAENWPTWARRYGIVCVTWTSVNLIFFGVVAVLVS